MICSGVVGVIRFELLGLVIAKSALSGERSFLPPVGSRPRWIERFTIAKKVCLCHFHSFVLIPIVTGSPD